MNEFKDFLAALGLRSGQIRSKERFHNAGWYNAAGVKIGWGDLTDQDLQNIRKNLPAEEKFIVLSERDSFWNFVEKVGIIGSMCQVNATEKNPGLQYLCEKVQLLIAAGNLYWFERYRDVRKGFLVEMGPGEFDVSGEISYEYIVGPKIPGGKRWTVLGYNYDKPSVTITLYDGDNYEEAARIHQKYLYEPGFYAEMYMGEKEEKYEK